MSPPSGMGAVLAIDHGTRRTGFAAIDALRIAPLPLAPFEGPGDGDELVDHVAELVEERSVVQLVVGYPYNMDGTKGPRADDVDAFIAALEKRLPRVAVARQDERLSTKEAEELLREAGRGGREGRPMRDSYSALVILRDWLEAN